MTATPPEVIEHRRSVDGIEHRWLESGDGRPVVLVHGIPTSAELWRHVMPLVDGARLLAWEMPGYGRSWDVPPGVDISVGAQAGRLLAWLDELSIDRAVLVGHDLGGGVVQIAAVRAPERCAALVLTNSIAYDSWPIPEFKAMRAAGPVVERLPGPLLRGQLAMMNHMGHDDRDRARESLEVHWTGYDHAQGWTAFVRQMRSLDCRDTEAVASALPRLEVPAALVWAWPTASRSSTPMAAVWPPTSARRSTRCRAPSTSHPRTIRSASPRPSRACWPSSRRRRQR